MSRCTETWISIQINQPTRCTTFSSLLLDVYLQLNMFRGALTPIIRSPARPRPTALLSPRSEGKTRGRYCRCWAPDDGLARNNYSSQGIINYPTQLHLVGHFRTLCKEIWHNKKAYDLFIGCGCDILQCLVQYLVFVSSFDFNLSLSGENCLNP